jgi:hypothetical protein
MKLLAAIAALSLVAAPVSAQKPCLSAPEAEALTLVALPDILRETGRICTGRLAPASPLRVADGSFLSRYDAEANRAWPEARAAIVKLSDPATDLLLGSQYARPVLVSVVVPLIVGQIAVDDCPVIDRMVTLLSPLPPRNVAGVVVETLRFLKTEKAKGRLVDVPDLPLCGKPR